MCNVPGSNSLLGHTIQRVAPTDPDVQISCIRFFPEWLRTILTAIRARLVVRFLRPLCATPVSHTRVHFRGILLSYLRAFPDQDFPRDSQ
jgi:hypothetical protein